MLISLIIISLVQSYEFPMKKSLSSIPNRLSNSINLASLNISNLYNLEYSIEAGFGSPSQYLTLSLSLLSSFIWVPSTVCECHVTSSSFDSDQSTTFVPTGQTVNGNFVAGTVSGELVNDNIEIGDFILENESFLLVDKDYLLDDLMSDGGIGLAHRKGTGFIEKLKTKGDIKESVFSFYLTNFDASNSLSDVFTIGEYNYEKYGKSSDLIEINIIHEEVWAASIEGFSIDGVSRSLTGQYAVFEVGYPFLVIPEVDFKTFEANLNTKVGGCTNNGVIVCECEFGMYSDYPTLNYKISGKSFTIHAENYIYFQENYCYLLIFGYQDYWYITQPFFREYYTVFRYEPRTITASPAFRDGREFNHLMKVFKAGVYVAGVVLIAALVKFVRTGNEGRDYVRI